MPAADQPAVYVIHENAAWMQPLRAAFAEQGVPFVEWFVHENRIPLGAPPPRGVFYNRMSASSHTRGHRYSAELTAQLLAWLQHHGRRVVNGRRALQLEISKFEQYLALREAGVPVPETIAASGRDEVLAAARDLGRAPFILKPNRGGKGLGVQLFQRVEDLERQLDAGMEMPLDGILLVQEYLRPAAGFITRMEFIGGRFFYQVEVDASQGFELCPADACEVGEAFCPAPGDHPAGVPAPSEALAGGGMAPTAAPGRFRISAREPDAALVARLEAFYRANDAEIAAAEHVEDATGRCVVYDINMNTNYNQEAERAAGNQQRAMHEVAAYLAGLLDAC